MLRQRIEQYQNDKNLIEYELIELKELKELKEKLLILENKTVDTRDENFIIDTRYFIKNEKEREKAKKASKRNNK